MYYSTSVFNQLIIQFKSKSNQIQVNVAQQSITIMSAQIMVLYPRKEDYTFDKEYYLNKHMGVAKRIWGPHGLKSYSVLDANADGPYAIVTVLDFEDAAGLGTAMTDPGLAELMGDVKNFTNIEPVVVHGAIAGRG
ncbi:ethyl tert-butyl ether degradation [Pyrenophora seminiperda CCB06]|uniref:Ethyl tert-butyl ether degradation n=1 Tax=Pyrenophora seminiperda CCB06 TaxID=1302712 RepID=A0A3M7LWZ4_9PLEO|nr:ethyl tert-butyl ether degradation [Pyrenophora seminiperda CCB06]